MTTLNIFHKTEYRYSEAVRRSAQLLRLTPATAMHQKVLHWQLKAPGSMRAFIDAYGNLSHLLTIDDAHEAIEIVAHGSVEVFDRVEGEAPGPIPAAVFQRLTPLTVCSPEMLAFLDPLRAAIRARPLFGLSDLASALLERMPYSPGATTVAFSAAQAFAAARGVCQDHTHAFIACCRALGLAARYVSGYVQAGELSHGSAHQAAAVASHAWTEAWIGNRWVSFDISNARAAGPGHVKLAVGLDYLDACPMRGVRLGGGEESMAASADVQSIDAGHVRTQVLVHNQ
jgi:transglutaminase-like putative cysteine protease